MLPSGWHTKAANLAVIPLLLFFAWLWVTRMPALMATLKPPHHAAGPTVPLDGPFVPTPLPGPISLAAPTRDPFQPPATMQATFLASSTTIGRGAATNSASLLLQGIIWGVQPPKAILNDHVLTIGESLNGAQIISIDSEGVTIEYQGQRAVLRLPSSPTSARD
ncbi:MAG: hypothetical protein A3C53_02215 [Omnitrophica WOR_2 bacterium RIFCSPHIGHO2_02_FULL_68_15]|nr:MAG: hypothetical protein A3C53_02215 [Omnitrophica WOR_2 bacterium RIFCSPHIGHO2_02_FULL_68_15]